jgi:hypothetical protein
MPGQLGQTHIIVRADVLLLFWLLNVGVTHLRIV